MASVHNTTQNSSDNLPSDKHHSSDVIYRRRGALSFQSISELIKSLVTSKWHHSHQ